MSGLCAELFPTTDDKVLAISFVVTCVVYNNEVYIIPNMADRVEALRYINLFY